ncbi:zinc finger protein 518A [Archocentrus centrarchus]|uniref:zinc finger protein 518A n=1 Tax=Archocentrus centrarchus TaxID=63155 RepID=UPI0011EA03D5|nr:zinc finger protein 518A-like [Archocentrus centrarchus]
MEEDGLPYDSGKNCSISVIEDEKEKVKDFVYKHFKEVTDGSLFNNAEESSIKEHGTCARKDKHTLNKAPCKIQQGAVFSGKILSFGCSVCSDNCTFSPNDLLKHFRAVHRGILPTYPCDLCDFVTNEFPALQRHRIEHRNTLVTCELCNDDVQYSLLLLTRHYIMCHSLNGQFSCDWCEFTTVDAGTFVQHIHHHNESHWKCLKCKHISLNEEDHQKHMKAHMGTFPFTCQVCGYGAARSEYLKKHMVAVHKEVTERKNAWKAIEDNSSPTNSSANLKLLLKKTGESQDSQRISKVNCLSGSLPNQNGKLIKADKFLEEIHHFVDGTVGKNDKTLSKGKPEQSTPDMLEECDNRPTSDAASHSGGNGLTVLMVKNKISLPPNCTTKVMGFKMVDGKKHLVLKVIPTAKQDVSSQNHSVTEGMSFSTQNSVLDKSKISEKELCCDSKSSTPQCLAVSPRSASCIQINQDILAVKVKIEEEETSIYTVTSTPHIGSEQANAVLDSTLNCAEVFCPTVDQLDDESDQSHPNETTSMEEKNLKSNSLTPICNHSRSCHVISSHAAEVCSDKISGLSSPSKCAQETLLSKPIFRKIVKDCGVVNEPSITDGNCNLKHKGSAFNTMENGHTSFHITPENDTFRTEMKHKNSQQNGKQISHHLSQLSPPTSVCCREDAIGSEKCGQNLQNQEVFTFHNYSKEAFNISTLNTTQENNSENKGHISEVPHFSLTLAGSPKHFTESADGDIVVDECIASVDGPTTEENSDLVLQDFNIVKIEEESIPISKRQSETTNSSTSLGSFVEEHSEAIITQQLNKERTGSLSANNESLKQTKRTLRILPLPDAEQPVLLTRASENQFAMPMQVKATPGFKLLTNSANPQINVSYIESSSKTTDTTLTPDSRRVGVQAAKPGAVEKGTALLTAVQPGVGTSLNHYLINSAGFKGSVLLSSTSQNSASDKAAKAQPTCYLVQRSVPFAQTPSTPSLRLASAQLPLNSRPVLAMPLSCSDKPSTLQTGRQAFLLRYISQPKSSLLLNNQEPNNGTHCSQTSESSGNKVIFKIVTPTGSLLTNGTPTSNSQPFFLATRPQTQCFLVSTNKTNATASSGVKKLITIQNAKQKEVTDSCISPSQINVKAQQLREAEKPILAPRPIRPPSQRKRRRKALFDELPGTVHKSRRFSNKAPTEKETVLWKPVAKEVERTLRLAPFSSLQQIKCPSRYQPVVVLNHPDADIPEVANIMKVVNRYKGAVTKVSLSQKTIQALLELGAQDKNSLTKGTFHIDDPKPRPIQSSVRERFLLKLKLRKKSKKKYEVIKTLSGCRQEQVMFDCWFCGRLFSNQEDWIGHGQRHLMEATRDWNKLF